MIEKLLKYIHLVPAAAAGFQGGHFAALEQPQLLFDDLMAFVDKIKAKL
jgi:hypothetical protein